MKEHEKLKKVYQKRKLFNIASPILQIVPKYKQNNAYNILLYMHVGDDFFRIAVSRFLHGNIHYIIPETYICLMKLFNITNYTILNIDNIVNNFVQNRLNLSKVCYDTFKFKCIESFCKSFPNKQEPFIIYSHNINYKMYLKKFKIKTMVDFICACLGIKKHKYKIDVNTINYPQITQATHERIQNIDLQKLIIIAPEARSDEMFDKAIWEKITSNLIKMGYTVIENIQNNENHILGTLNYNLNLEELLQIAMACRAVFSIRSGLCDILAGKGKDLHILYTKERYNDLKPFFSLRENFKFNKAGFPKEYIIDINKKNRVLFENKDLIKGLDNKFMPGKIKKLKLFGNEKNNHHKTYIIFGIKLRFKNYRKKHEI
jgi:hypothetical protein